MLLLKLGYSLMTALCIGLLSHPPTVWYFNQISANCSHGYVPGKCIFTLISVISYPLAANAMKLPSYHLSQNTLSVTMDSYPYLGVTISSDLCCDRHITVISTNATWAVNFVCQNIYRCTPEAKELAYTSLLRPAWDPYVRQWQKTHCTHEREY